jgi:hypothetical protein
MQGVVLMEYYSMSQFAELIDRTEQTLRNWDKKECLNQATLRRQATVIIPKISLIQIINVFSYRFQENRVIKAKKMIKELTESDNVAAGQAGA